MNPKLVPVLPWYRHRWPWLLMLGPFVVVVAGIVTAWLAFRSNDGLVVDDYYKQGLAVNQATLRDRRAAQLGVRGELSIDPVRQLVRVTLRSGKSGEMPPTLALTFSHPTRGGLDRTLRLLRDETGSLPDGAHYAAGSAGELAGRWHVTLEGENREWRLVGTWDLAQQPVFTLQAQP